MIRGLVHIGITAANFDRMLAFYRDVIRLTAGPVVRHPRGGRKVCLRGVDAEVIELIEYPDPKPHQGRDRDRTGIHHFGLVVDDVRAEEARLTALGLEMDGTIKSNTVGDLVLHFFDPDGNRVHFTQIHSR